MSKLEMEKSIDAVGLLHPGIEGDPTYAYSKKRIDYIFISSQLTIIVINAEHHQFHQHFVSDHIGFYLQFRASDLFDS